MHKQDMLKDLKNAGLKLIYKPRWEYESETISLDCRKPPCLTDGLLRGIQAVCTTKGVQVWTSKKKLAKTIAAEIKCPIRLYDTEAEITIPYASFDTYARKLGVKIKKTISKDTMDRLKKAFK